MKTTILDKTKKKKFIEGFSEFGLEKIPQVLIKSGAERVRAFSGDLTRDELNEFLRNLPVEGIGLYVGKEMIDRHGVLEVRLSLDGLHLWKEQIKNNIIELSLEDEEKWFSGKDLTLLEMKTNSEGAKSFGKGLEFNNEDLKGKFVAIKSKDSGDFIGTGKISQDGKTLYNYLPKERRRKSQTI